MKVYITQGMHYSVPGQPMSVHVTRAGAEARALELVNLLLKDLGEKLAEDWEAGLSLVQTRVGGDEADVWITEYKVES